MAAPSKCASRNALIDQPLGEPSKSPSERPTRRVGESFAYMYEGRDMSHVDDGLIMRMSKMMNVFVFRFRSASILPDLFLLSMLDLSSYVSIVIDGYKQW